MPLIAMTREMGSLGKDVAAGVAQQMNRKVVYHEIIDQLADKMRLRKSHVERFLDGRAGFWERMTTDQTSLSIFTADETFKILRNGGAAVIRGWGAAHLLRDVPHVIRVRVCAPHETKVERMMERLDTDRRDAVVNEIAMSEEAHNGDHAAPFRPRLARGRELRPGAVHRAPERRGVRRRDQVRHPPAPLPGDGRVDARRREPLPAMERARGAALQRAHHLAQRRRRMRQRAHRPARPGGHPRPGGRAGEVAANVTGVTSLANELRSTSSALRATFAKPEKGTMKPISATNDFVVKFATSTARLGLGEHLFAKPSCAWLPVSPRNIFPSNIQGCPRGTRCASPSAAGSGGRGGVDLMVAMNPRPGRRTSPRSSRAATSSTIRPSRWRRTSFRDDVHVIACR
jgi:hypothetical protein